MKKVWGISLLVAAGIFVLAACGGAEKAEPTKAPGAAPAPAAPAVAPAPAAALTLQAKIALRDASAKALGVTLQVPKPATTKPVYGGEATIAYVSEPPGFDTMRTRGMRAQIPLSFVLDNLVHYRVGPQYPVTDYTATPSLAEKWEASGDGLTWTFHIRKGVRFVGKPEMPIDREVTADDVVYTFNRALTWEQSTIKSHIRQLDSVTKVDDSTVVMKLKKPQAAWLYKMGGRQTQIIPHEAVEKYGDMVKWESVVGTGPYVLKSYLAGSEVLLEKNPKFWEKDEKGNQLPFIDKVHVQIINDERLQDAGFRTGKITALGIETCGISTERYNSIIQTNPQTVLEIFVDSTNQRAVGMRVDKAPWNNIDVRHAMALSLDREGFIKSVLGGWGVPSEAVTPGATAFWLPTEYLGEGAQWSRYDPEQAKKLMKDAGYGGGVKTTMVHTNSLGTRWLSEGELFAESLRQIGIDVTIQLLDYNLYAGMGYGSGELEELFYNAAGFGFDPDEVVKSSLHSKEGGGAVFKLNDPKLDALLDAQSEATSLEQRIQLMYDFQRYMAVQRYLIYVPAWIYIEISQPELKNWAYHYSANVGGAMARAWVERR